MDTETTSKVTATPPSFKNLTFKILVFKSKT